jgi:hypothetical protein
MQLSSRMRLLNRMLQDIPQKTVGFNHLRELLRGRLRAQNLRDHWVQKLDPAGIDRRHAGVSGKSASDFSIQGRTTKRNPFVGFQFAPASFQEHGDKLRAALGTRIPRIYDNPPGFSAAVYAFVR